jgi:cytochrome P450
MTYAVVLSSVPSVPSVDHTRENGYGNHNLRVCSHRARSTRHRYAYSPFSGGPRQCIGNTFALAEAQLVLATIAQRFPFAAVGQDAAPARAADHTATAWRSAGFRRAALTARLEARELAAQHCSQW